LTCLSRLAPRKITQPDQQSLDIASGTVVRIQESRFARQQVGALSRLGIHGANKERVGCLNDLVASLDVDYFANYGAGTLVGQRPDQKDEYRWYQC
jgi:hypothetical protein